MQLSADTLPFPDAYEVEAARIVQMRGADPGVASVSEPQTTLGVTALSSKRWYVCVRGIPASGKQPPLRAAEVVETWLGQRRREGNYDVVLFFSGLHRPSVQEGFDSPLCRDLHFRAIAAAPPLV